MLDGRPVNNQPSRRHRPNLKGVAVPHGILCEHRKGQTSLPSVRPLRRNKLKHKPPEAKCTCVQLETVHRAGWRFGVTHPKHSIPWVVNADTAHPDLNTRRERQLIRESPKIAKGKDRLGKKQTDCSLQEMADYGGFIGKYCDGVDSFWPESNRTVRHNKPRIAGFACSFSRLLIQPLLQFSQTTLALAFISLLPHVFTSRSPANCLAKMYRSCGRRSPIHSLHRCSPVSVAVWRQKAHLGISQV
jgi:hypothetical protein